MRRAIILALVVVVMAAGRRAITNADITATLPTTLSVETSAAAPATKVAIMRLTLVVSGAPETLTHFEWTPSNTSDADVSNVKLWLNAAPSAPDLSTAVQQGATKAIGNPVAWDVGDGTPLSAALPVGTSYLWVTYDLAAGAVAGNLLDGSVAVNKMTISGSTYRTDVALDPAGKIVVKRASSFAPTAFAVGYSTGTAPGDTFVTFGAVANLAGDNAAYAGLNFGNANTNPAGGYDVWTQFDYQLPAGTTGSQLRSVTFRAQMFLTGGTTPDSATNPQVDPVPANNPVEWNGITDARVQVYNWTTGGWESMGEAFATLVDADYEWTPEAVVWDEETDKNPQNPLIRSRVSNFDNGYLSGASVLRLRTLIHGGPQKTTPSRSDMPMIFDYALAEVVYNEGQEQLNFNWCDADELPLSTENVLGVALTNQDLHLRVGVRPNTNNWTSHFLALQYDTVSTFANADADPTAFIVTPSSANVRMWDDVDHADGDAVINTGLVSGSPLGGVFHEDAVPPAQTKTGGTVYEEDFTVRPVAAGTYYLRVVRLDSLGNFRGLLPYQAHPIPLIVSNALIKQDQYNWANDAAVAVKALTWGTPNTALGFTTGAVNHVTFRFGDLAAGAYPRKWCIQTRDVTGSPPGPWYFVTTNSVSDIDGPLQAETACTTNDGQGHPPDNLMTPLPVGATNPGGTAEVDGGEYVIMYFDVDADPSGDDTFTNDWIEYVYAVKFQTAAAGKRFQFRVVNGDGTTYPTEGIRYDVLAEARQVVHEQVSSRWADENEAVLEDENNVLETNVNTLLHLRLGVRSKNGGWPAHTLTLEYDTNPNFTAPTAITTASANVRMWDDSDHLEGDAVSTLILSGGPLAGAYHEDQTPPAQNKNGNTLYEEDFTLRVLTADTVYFIRIAGINSVLAEASVVARDPATDSRAQAANNWTLDGAALSWGTQNATLNFTTGSTYIMAQRIDKIGPGGAYSWQLQYRKDPDGLWTNVNAASADWKAVAAVNRANDATVDITPYPTEAACAAGAGTEIDGVFSSDGIAGHTLPPATPCYTELWFSVQPQASAAGNTYSFRVVTLSQSLLNAAPAGFTTGSSPAIATVASGVVGSLASDDDATYAGLQINNNVGAANDPQEVWTEFTYAVGGTVGTGSNIDKVTFRGQLHVTGDDGGFGPAGPAAPDPGEWTTRLDDSRVLVDGGAVAGWINVGASFTSPLVNWENSAEAVKWDQIADSNPENPLVRIRKGGFTDAFINAGNLSIRVRQKGKFLANGDDLDNVFDYAWIDVEYGAASVTYAVYPKATQRKTQQVSYRWADAGEATLANENSVATVSATDLLHLRVGFKSKNLSFDGRRLGLQYDDNDAFSSPTLMTTLTPELQMWDDADRVEGATVAALVLSGSPTAGVYHETNLPPIQNFNADTLFEEDFTVKPLSNGNYFIRVVEVDGAGALVGTLNEYLVTVELEVAPPGDDQAAYRWMDSTGAPLAATNAEIEFAPSTSYIVALRDDHSGSPATRDWRLQYQKINGTPGDWTDVTPASSEWKGVDLAYGADGAAVATGSFVTGAGVGAAIAGEYSEDGLAEAFLLGTTQYTELWYAVQPQAAATGNLYKFRVTNNGSPSGFTYTQYAQARDTTHEQVSYRWAGDNESAVATQNNAYDAIVGEQLHLRVGVRANNGAWAAHKLALQYDDNAGFASPTPLTAGSVDLFMWNDVDHLDGAAMSGANLLSGTPSDELYHEVEVQPGTHAKGADTLYEVDFTVQVVTTGTWYLRVMDVSGGSPGAAIDTYTVTIQVNVSNANLSQAAYNWAANAAVPAWLGANTTLEYTIDTDYIMAVRVERTVASATGAVDWTLQFQKNQAGPWTTVTDTSSEWRSVNGVYGADGAAVPTASFVCGAGAGAAQIGQYDEDAVVSAFDLAGTSHTEFWWSIRPLSGATLAEYRFRVLRAGSTSGITYTINPRAAQRETVQTAYRWADASDIAVQNENNFHSALVGDTVHVRVGVKSKNLAWNGHDLAMQYDTDSNFTSGDGFNPKILTNATPELAHWDDADHADAAAMGATNLLSGSPSDGVWHEIHNQAASLNKSADTVYEEDFSVTPLVTGTYYLRVVRVDAAGALVGPLNTYSVNCRLDCVTANNAQSAFAWAPDAAALTWQADNVEFYYTTGSKYIVALRLEHDDPNSNFTWQIQYQKTNGTPGSWTTVTAASVDWQSVAPTDYVAKADGASVTAAEVLSNADGTDSVGGKTDVAGRFDTNGSEVFNLSTGNLTYTEFWFSITPTASAADNEYRFRLTNGGSTTSFSYSSYPTATNFKKISSGNWTTAGNWSPSGEPTSGQNAAVLGAVTMDDTVSGDCRVLEIRSGGDLAVAASGVLNVANELRVQAGGALRATNAGATVNVSQNATVASSGTLELGNTGALKLAASKSLTVDGTFRATPSGASKPTLTRIVAGTINVVLKGTVDVTGLNFSFGDLEGLDIDGATISALKNVTFSNVDASAGARHMTIRRTTLSLGALDVYWGALGAGQFNLRLIDTDASGSDVIVFLESRDDATHGPGRGEAFESEVGGSTISWLYSVTDHGGTGLPSGGAAFDLTTFTWYATYNAFTDPAGNDVIYALDVNGKVMYSYPVAQAPYGDIVGAPWWDTNGALHVLYFGTSNGYLFRLIDTGAALTTAGGGWILDLGTMGTPCDEVTSPVISDGANVYFGGRDGAVYRAYAVSIAGAFQWATVGVPIIRQAPSWENVGGSTYLYAASDVSGGIAHIYRIDSTSGAITADNTLSKTHDIRVFTTLAAGRLIAGDYGGRLQVVETASPGFTDYGTFPVVSPGHVLGEATAKITGAALFHWAELRYYYGDIDGHFYILNDDTTAYDPDGGGPITPYPIQPEPGKAIGTFPLFENGLIYFGNDNGKLFLVDRATKTISKTYNFGPNVKVTDLVYVDDTSAQDKIAVTTSNGYTIYIAVP